MPSREPVLPAELKAILVEAHRGGHPAEKIAGMLVERAKRRGPRERQPFDVSELDEIAENGFGAQLKEALIALRKSFAAS